MGLPTCNMPTAHRKEGAVLVAKAVPGKPPRLVWAGMKRMELLAINTFKILLMAKKQKKEWKA